MIMPRPRNRIGVSGDSVNAPVTSTKNLAAAKSGEFTDDSLDGTARGAEMVCHPVDCE